jgi:hypothetical protein
LKRTLQIFALLAGFLVALQIARAQEVAAYLGVGGAYATSNSQQIDTFSDGNLHSTPSLNSVMTDLGATVFVGRNWGAGAELAWRPNQGDYAGLQYRSSFYNFDAIYRPERGLAKRLAPEFRAGIGGARIRFNYDDQTSCDQVPGCPDTTHFQVHLGAAARWYFNDHVFLRPALDVHYVHNLFEFGSNWVPRYSVSVGYSFGRE